MIKDPRQEVTLNLYTDPSSPTFGNLYQSFIQGGYSKTTALSIGGSNTPDWITDNVKSNVDMVKIAERNLKKYLEVEIDTDDRTRGTIDMAKLQVDVSKFITKTLARSKYSEAQEDKAPSVNVKIVNYGSGVTDVEVEGDVIEGT